MAERATSNPVPFQMDSALSSSAKLKEDSDFAKFSLFGEDEIKSLTKFAPLTTTSNAEWTDDMLLSYEKEVLGLYLSGHPLIRYQSEMASYTTCSIGHLPEAGTVRIAGHVLSVRRMTTKKGNLMARFVLEDLEGLNIAGSMDEVSDEGVNALLAMRHLRLLGFHPPPSISAAAVERLRSIPGLSFVHGGCAGLFRPKDFKVYFF